MKISIHKVDLSSVEQIEGLYPAIQQEHARAVDILVSNAGYGVRIRDIWDIPLSEFDQTLNVNLRGAFLITKAVATGMRDQRWGRIIYVSSIAAYGAGINGCRESIESVPLDAATVAGDMAQIMLLPRVDWWA